MGGLHFSENNKVERGGQQQTEPGAGPQYMRTPAVEDPATKWGADCDGSRVSHVEDSHVPRPQVSWCHFRDN